MKRTFVLHALLALSAGGCGTALNTLEDRRWPYGGVFMDGAMVAGCAAQCTGLTPKEEHPKIPPETMLLLGGCALLDFPLSLVGDTLTLPYTVPVTLAKLFAPDEAGGQEVTQKKAVD